jgi:hypothetical protein
VTLHKHVVLFITANEEFNAGERDSMKALALEIKDHERDDIAYITYKIPTTPSPVSGNPLSLPVDNALYAKIPTVDAETSDLVRQTAHLTLIGVGNSTFKTLVELHDAALKDIKTYFITHLINDIDDLRAIHTRHIHVFSPMKKDDLTPLDPDMAQGIALDMLETMPHTNTHLSQEDYKEFMATPNGQQMQKILDRKQDFAFVVLNGGTGIGETRTHYPYNEEEAAAHGYALGHHAKAGTALIVTHGGPRNLIDENEFGQMTMQAFAKAYTKAQSEKGDKPVILLEPFVPNRSYNAIKAGYVLGQSGHCVAFVSNAEGYGTMIGAIIHIDNHKKILGMFPFKAWSRDNPDLQAEDFEKYHRGGIAELYASPEGIIIRRHPQEVRTPANSGDPTRQIIEKLDLIHQEQK